MPDRPPENHEATYLEDDDDIRQALLKRLAETQGKGQADVPPASAKPDAKPDRPLHRVPTPVLCICDDGSNDGEWVRLRAEQYIIGRTAGDIQIPHDLMISGRHAMLTRQPVGDSCQWVIEDLQSTNGTFVRVNSTRLRAGSEIRIGSTQFRFEAESTESPRAPIQATLAGSGNPLQSMVPSLVEFDRDRVGRRFPLVLAEYWIGRDADACAIACQDDEFASPQHARLHRAADGQWHVTNNNSLNGLWLRVSRLVLPNACQFRLGEQRFYFRVN